MAYKTKAERLLDAGDLRGIAREIVADLMTSLRKAETVEEKLRISAELHEWLAKANTAPGPAVETAVPAPPEAERRAEVAGFQIDWEDR